MKRLVIGGLLAVILLVINTGCTVATRSDHHHGYGPAPHAPAHGYRHYHRDHGLYLEYDSRMGIYFVVDFPDYYYHDGHYYRWWDKHWHRADHPRARWQHVPHKHVPPRVYRKYYKQRDNDHRWDKVDPYHHERDHRDGDRRDGGDRHHRDHDREDDGKWRDDRYRR